MRVAGDGGEAGDRRQARRERVGEAMDEPVEVGVLEAVGGEIVRELEPVLGPDPEACLATVLERVGDLARGYGGHVLRVARDGPRLVDLDVVVAEEEVEPAHRLPLSLGDGTHEVGADALVGGRELRIAMRVLDAGTEGEGLERPDLDVRGHPVPAYVVARRRL